MRFTICKVIESFHKNSERFQLDVTIIEIYLNPFKSLLNPSDFANHEANLANRFATSFIGETTWTYLIQLNPVSLAVSNMALEHGLLTRSQSTAFMRTVWSTCELSERNEDEFGFFRTTGLFELAVHFEL